jgi:hypothetical protein
MHQEESLGEGSAQGVKQADHFIPSIQEPARVQCNLEDLVTQTEEEAKDVDEVSHKTSRRMRAANPRISCSVRER